LNKRKRTTRTLRKNSNCKRFELGKEEIYIYRKNNNCERFKPRRKEQQEH
jgi:hypothetical protein